MSCAFEVIRELALRAGALACTRSKGQVQVIAPDRKVFSNGGHYIVCDDDDDTLSMLSDKLRGAIRRGGLEECEDVFCEVCAALRPVTVKELRALAKKAGAECFRRENGVIDVAAPDRHVFRSQGLHYFNIEDTPRDRAQLADDLREAIDHGGVGPCQDRDCLVCDGEGEDE